jgi:hypothetical protein
MFPNEHRDADESLAREEGAWLRLWRCRSQGVSFKLENAELLPWKYLIPCTVYCIDRPITLDPERASIGNHAAQKGGGIRIGLRRFAVST